MKCLFLLLLSPLIALSQADYFVKYYPQIDLAEKKVLEGDYRRAQFYYSEAFSAVQEPLARDIYNAVVCNFLLKDFTGAKPLLIVLAKKGVSLEILESNDAFHLEKVKHEWANFKLIYTQIANSFTRNIPFSVDEKIKKYELVRVLEGLRRNRIFENTSSNVDFVSFEGKKYQDIWVDSTRASLYHDLSNYWRENEGFSEYQVGIDDPAFLQNNYAMAVDYLFGKFVAGIKTKPAGRSETTGRYNSLWERDVKEGKLHRSILRRAIPYTEQEGIEIMQIQVPDSCKLSEKAFYRRRHCKPVMAKDYIAKYEDIDSNKVLQSRENIHLFLMDFKIWTSINEFGSCTSAEEYIDKENIEQVPD